MAEIKVLSAGAVRAGLSKLARAFEAETGHKVVITFATAPVLRGKVEEKKELADVVIAPLPIIKDFEKNESIVLGSSAVVGKVRAAVVVRDGPWEPEISTVEALKEALLDSRSIVYNEASSGLYVEKLMDRLGIAEEAKAKTTRVPTADAIMRHLAGSKVENEIGFGQVPAILVYKDQGVKLVGALPKEVENVTTYSAAVLADARAPEPAEKFIQFLTTLFAKKSFLNTGVE